MRRIGLPLLVETLGNEKVCEYEAAVGTKDRNGGSKGRMTGL